MLSHPCATHGRIPSPDDADNLPYDIIYLLHHRVYPEIYQHHGQCICHNNLRLPAGLYRCLLACVPWLPIRVPACAIASESKPWHYCSYDMATLSLGFPFSEFSVGELRRHLESQTIEFSRQSLQDYDIPPITAYLTCAVGREALCKQHRQPRCTWQSLQGPLS